MRQFGAAKVKRMFEKMGGTITYTPPSGSAITSVALYNPGTEQYDANGMVVSSSDNMISLLREDITARPVHNATIVYTDPDSGVVSTFKVDEFFNSDTHVWRIIARKIS